MSRIFQRGAAWVMGILAGAMMAHGAASGSGGRDWPMLGHDIARSGVTPAEVRPPFARKWYRAFPDEGIMAGVQPVIAENRVFVGTLKGLLHAMDASSGKDLWVFEAQGPILHACAVGEDRVFFGAADGAIYGVNAADGKLAWRVQTGSAIWNAPVIHEGLVLIGSRDGKLYACETTSGRIRWTGPTGGPILNSPAIDAQRGRVYVGSEDMHAYAFELATGRQVWRSQKLPGVSFRGYHPVIAPDGSVMLTVTPCLCADTIQEIMTDMVKAVFGNFSNWRNKKEENERLRKENFALMQQPETYRKQLDYLRQRLAEEPAYQTFFVLDPATGKQKFVVPIVYAESMNGPGSPPLVTPEGKIVVKYSALLRSRYEHYSPFLNVGYLDTARGHITPIMDQSRTYGWHESLLLVHDEQSQLALGGRVLFNTHQDNVNAMDLDTLKGYGGPMCWGVHEVKDGTANSLWSIHLSGRPLPMGWEWFARGTAIYGGGSVIDVPIAIAGDSFYYLPTHEINAGVVVLAYTMDPSGSASSKAPEPTEKLSAEHWEKIKSLKWEWDLLGMPRLNTVLKANLPEPMPGTRARPLEQSAQAAVERIADAQLDSIIWDVPAARAAFRPDSLARYRQELERAVGELTASEWRPMLFPAGKYPSQAYRFFVDPTETLYTLALAYPSLSPEMQAQVKAHLKKLSENDGPLSGLTGRKAYDPAAGQVRTLYDPAPESLMRVENDLIRSETARLYPLWLWAQTTGDWERLGRDWPRLKSLIREQPERNELDCGNARLAGLMAACRIAKQMNDTPTLEKLLPATRQAMRSRLRFELSHTEGGLIDQVPTLRTIFARWHFLTPDVARLLQRHAQDIHRRLMDVYVDHHRPTWFLAWNVELLWRNETPLLFPTAPCEIFAARALILQEDPETLAKAIDQPWCKADEFYVQKLALLLRAAREAQ